MFDPSSISHAVANLWAQLKELIDPAFCRPQQLGAIVHQMKRRMVPAGTVIVTAGQPRSDLFIVVAGRVGAVGGALVGRFGPGEHFGEYALFADTPYQATYRAIEPTTLLTLDEPTFDALVAGSQRMAHYVEQVGSGRLLLACRRGGR